MKEEFKAWAIDTQSEEGHGFIGRYYFTSAIPPSSEGCLTALFKSRAIARDYLAENKSQPNSQFPLAKVVRVKVVIEVEE